MRILSTVLSLLVGIFSVAGQEIDLIKYADFENWVTRNITERKHKESLQDSSRNGD